MNQPTRRIRAGSPPPTELPLDFTEPDDFADVSLTTVEWVAITTIVCSLFGFGVIVGRWLA